VRVTAVHRAGDETDVGLRFADEFGAHHLGAAVGGRVIHDDDFDRHIARLAQRTQTIAQQRARVVIENDET